MGEKGEILRGHCANHTNIPRIQKKVWKWVLKTSGKVGREKGTSSLDFLAQLQ